jgi:acyl-CoA thioesterase I
MLHKAGTLTAMAVAALLPVLTGSASAQTAAASCGAPSILTRLDGSIARTAARLAEGRSLKIVALGSSSTFGVGASSSAHSYPSRLEAELREQFPDMEIVVLNRGVGGEDAREELARLDKSVVAEHPDLVLWQVGTNAIVDAEGMAREEALVRKGFARLKASGADVILMDPQYSPKVIGMPKAAAMIRMLQRVAASSQVGVFRRYEIMSHWQKVEHVPFERFTVKDGLHMNDWGYDCIAKLLAASIVVAAGQPAPASVASRTYTLQSFEL